MITDQQRDDLKECYQSGKSVRAAAKDSHVSHTTSERHYQRLKREGVSGVSVVVCAVCRAFTPITKHKCSGCRKAFA